MFPNNLKRIIPVFLILSTLIWGCASEQKKTDSYISEAEAYFQTGEYEKALIQLKNAIKLAPESIKAHTLMAKTHLKLKDAPNAYKTLLRLEQLAPEDLDTKLELAGFAILAKDLTQARKRVDFILEKNPDHIKALYLNAGLIAREKALPESMAGIYRRILELDPKQVRAHIALAGIYTAGKETQRAETHLKAARDLDPENLGIYRALYGLYLSQQERDKAEDLLKQLAASMPGKGDAQVMLGSHYLSVGKQDEAVAVLEKAIVSDPQNIKPHLVLARHFNAAGAPEKAENYIQKAVAIAPDNHELKLLHAEFLLSHKNLEQAEALVDEILKARPAHAPSRAIKGKILAQKKQLDKAIAIFRELVQEEPNSAPTNFMLGSTLIKRGRSKEGLPYISKTLELAPNHLPARMVMAGSHLKNKDYFLAETEVNHVLASTPDNYSANILLGNIHLARNELDQARAVYERMIVIAPDNPAAYFRLGLVCRAEKKTEAALENFNKALARNPMLMDVFTQLIDVHAGNNAHQQAITVCDSHLEKVAGTPIAASVILNLKAGLLIALGQTEPAKQSLELSIRKNPAYIPPYLTLAGLHKAGGNTDQAMALYTELIRHRPDQAAPHTLLGTLYEKKNKWDLAETHYKKSLSVNPNFIPALNNLAFLYAQQNRNLDEALALARQARVKTGGIPAVIDTLGWVYYKKQLYPSAAQEFKACVDKEPQNPVFHYHLGMTYNKMWKYEQARAALEKALALKPDFKGSGEARKILEQL
ncbi:MAG: tetratricopeptide repeat protein [Desulfobacter sp.]|nr:MAG: tetratricopeptide repeat protein [Desulfobacter sp.]